MLFAPSFVVARKRTTPLLSLAISSICGAPSSLALSMVSWRRLVICLWFSIWMVSCVVFGASATVREISYWMRSLLALLRRGFVVVTVGRAPVHGVAGEAAAWAYVLWVFCNMVIMKSCFLSMAWIVALSKVTMGSPVSTGSV